uniref:Rho GTPase activating protein 27 n=1 Tax=Labrus bergylta TaxID=56723 RepID=A0A3Q3NPX7_9LABR
MFQQLQDVNPAAAVTQRLHRSMELVLVQFDFEYTGKDGRLVSIKTNESYILLSKTNEHWWHVCKDQHTRPFYVPAQYVKEVQSVSADSTGLKEKLDPPECEANSKPVEVAIVTPAKTFTRDGSGGKYRFSTFGFWQTTSRSSSFAENLCDKETKKTSASLDNDKMQLYAKPHRALNLHHLAFLQVENESLRSAVYVNVAQLRQSISESPPSAPSSYSPSYLDPEGWEVHVDQESGQEYYFHPSTGRTTWDKDPCSPSPLQSPALSPSTAFPSGWTSEWEQLVDEDSGQPYFYNPMSGETSWEPPEQLSPYPHVVFSPFFPPQPPLPEEDYPAEDYPAGEQPEPSDMLLATGPPTLPKEYTLSHVSRTIIPRASLDRSTHSGWNLNVDPSGTWVFTSEHSPEQVHPHFRAVHFINSNDIKMILGNSLGATVAVWLHCFFFFFFFSVQNKTNQIVPEVTVDLRGATIGWASRDKSSKKNVLELKGKNGVEFLIQYDTESIISDWHKATAWGPMQIDELPPITEEKLENHSSGSECANFAMPLGILLKETDQKRVRTKLMKFLMKRPTLQSVKEKGYIRENVFGCQLATLCAQERTTVPSFVEKCIKAVERRGLDIDGLYRVSGNLAVIQKLRYKADHEELDLEDGLWEDVHVITGALKLFFRELTEPLFPFSHFNDFITAIRIPDYNTKLDCIYELVRTLPAPNHDTMKLLFGHLYKLIQHGEDNRMTVQNVAIVFGPTLLRPEMESSNIAMHMVFQNQIVEFILNEYEHIFYSS